MLEKKKCRLTTQKATQLATDPRGAYECTDQTKGPRLHTQRGGARYPKPSEEEWPHTTQKPPNVNKMAAPMPD